MSQAKNKVEWCLRKAEKELKESGSHRGLVESERDFEKAKSHIKKAERYLTATEYIKRGGYSDIATGTIFYAMYHCLLAISVKHGYESRNQECTFALMNILIEDKKIDFSKEILDRIALAEPKDGEETEKTTVKIRERFQYGTEFNVEDDLYNELVNLAKEVISMAKVIVEG